MSGGFFRGTSAEQDTRFSNKQAKLLKSHKFPPELEHPVDMTKVKMDVIRPWIATRVTELLGFEDEVLINFVYGLLDGKALDGKQIQIQLTGFLEKNTGKFMKELWGLLLSAQNNSSGVPQQFLDAKQEEMRKRKLENDMITQEIQKRKDKEGREIEQEKHKRMDMEAGHSRSANAVSGSSSRHSQLRDSRLQSEKEKDTEIVKSPGVKQREGWSRSASVSSQSHSHSVSPSRRYHSPLRHSISSERRYKSPTRRSISPHRRYSPRNNWSPLRHKSPYAKQRLPSTTRRRSPLHRRRKSPFGRRSPLSLRHRSPTSRHRSPIQNHRRSPSPGRRWDSPSKHHRDSPSPASYRRSPFPGRQRRSPSPIRRKRSPLPTHRSSPSLAHHRRSPPSCCRVSPSPSLHRRSPSPRHRRSPSPMRHMSPVRHRFFSPQQHRSLSPRKSSPDASPQRQGRPSRGYGADSQPSQMRKSHSPNRTLRGSSREIDSRSIGFNSRRHEDGYASDRVRERRSLTHGASHKVVGQHTKHNISDHAPPKLSGCSRSSSRDSRDQIDIHDKDHGVLSENSSGLSASPSNSRRTSPRRNRLSVDTTTKQFEKQMPQDVIGINNEKEHSGFLSEDGYHNIDSPSEKDIQSHQANVKSKKENEHNSDVDISRRNESQVSQSLDGREHGPGKGVRGGKHSSRDRQRSPDAKMQPQVTNYEEETKERKHRSSGKRKHKKSDKHRRDSDYDSESDSDIEHKKEAKRRRKDERRLRKEEMRRRHEEKHHKRRERHVEKHKMIIADTVTPPSDLDKDLNDTGRLGDVAALKKGGPYLPHTAFETESKEKKLEIELREKALKSLRERKAIKQ
ncbi:uncharacterized protein LOC141836378 [Curcuma longa]|uniref:uncharacterized protein LOC141836378 n=1 Tax=Curcuma longa TaxID=136217 RepID=UPI003D9EBFD4